MNYAIGYLVTTKQAITIIDTIINITDRFVTDINFMF